MSENKTTYESLDGKIAPEALLKDTRGKLQMVDGHGIKQEADYDLCNVRYSWTKATL